MEAQPNFDWNDLSRSHLPESFIRKNGNKLNWEIRCQYYRMTEEEQEKYCEYFNMKAWKNLFMYQLVIENFMEKHIDIIKKMIYGFIHMSGKKSLKVLLKNI